MKHSAKKILITLIHVIKNEKNTFISTAVENKTSFMFFFLFKFVSLKIQKQSRRLDINVYLKFLTMLLYSSDQIL